MDTPKTEVTKSNSQIIFAGSPVDGVFNKAEKKDKVKAQQGFVFEEGKQRNARMIQKGITKPGKISYETLRRAANSVHIARICITTLKEKVTKTPWIVKMIDPLVEKDEKKIKKIEDLLKHPNTNDETFRTLLDKILEDLLILDAVSIEKTRFNDGTLAELHFIDSATIRPVYDEQGNQDVKINVKIQKKDKDGATIRTEEDMTVSYVQVLQNSQYGGPESGQIVAAWEKKDFIHFHMHPQGAMENFGYGLSPLESVLSVVSNILNADNYNGTFFEEGAFPPLIMQFKGQMNERDLNAFREYIYQEIQGNFHRPAILAGGEGVEIHNLKDQTNREAEFMEYMKFLARLLAAAYGLSGQDIGLTDDVNRATSETMHTLTQEKGYGSILHLIKEVINQEIIWKDFGYESIEFDWCPDDQIDPKDAIDLYDKGLRNGAFTINEVREKLGEKPFGSWADEPMMLGINGYMPMLAKDNHTADADIEEEENPSSKEEKKPMEEKKKVGGETKYQDQEVKKSIITPTGYKCWADDRGYGQPFIFMEILSGSGFVIKPPVAVNVMSQNLEESITLELSEMGLNVVPVTRMTLPFIAEHVLPYEILGEFQKYQDMTPEYDSEKWRNKFGGSRKYAYYHVSSFIDGYALNNPILIQDMRRDPDSYKEAVMDLVKLWNVEKKQVLGDRRADQYIITPDKRAYGFDYQFKGDKKRWEDTNESIANVLIQIPELHDLFLENIIKSK